MTVGVALCSTSSTIRKRGRVLMSRPSGEWVARICFITTLSSEEEKRWRSALIMCVFAAVVNAIAEDNEDQIRGGCGVQLPEHTRIYSS